MAVGRGYSLEKWATPIIKILGKGRGVRRLKSGDFTYIELEVTDIEYNNPALY